MHVVRKSTYSANHNRGDSNLTIMMMMIMIFYLLFTQYNYTDLKERKKALRN